MCKPRNRSTTSPASGRTTSRSSSCTTASRPTSCCSTRRLGLCAEGEAAKLDRQRRHHLRRTLGRQPVRRPDLQGPSARCDRSGAVRRADLAAARHRRQATGRQRHRGAAAQHRSRRRRRRHRVPASRALNHQQLQGNIMGHIEATKRTGRQHRTRCGPLSPTSLNWGEWFTVHEKWLEEPPAELAPGNRAGRQDRHAGHGQQDRVDASTRSTPPPAWCSREPGWRASGASSTFTDRRRPATARTSRCPATSRAR